MTYWVFDTQAAAAAASQLTALLAARAMNYRGGWRRDDGLRAIGRDRLGRWHPEVVVAMWDTPRETVGGQWAIMDPIAGKLRIDGAVVPAGSVTLTEAPAVLAASAGQTVADWASVYRDMQMPYMPGDEDTEITLPAVAWVRAALLASGLSWTEGTAEFPPEEIV